MKRRIRAATLAATTLLNGADPILEDYHDHAITPAQASQRMGALESTFARPLTSMTATSTTCGTPRTHSGWRSSSGAQSSR